MSRGTPGYNIPGIRPYQFTDEAEISWAYETHLIFQSGPIDSTAADSGNTGSTDMLRAGLMMGGPKSDGNYYQWSPAATDGSENFFGLMKGPLKLTDGAGIARDKLTGRIVVRGVVKASEILIPTATSRGLNGDADEIAARNALRHRGFLVDDDLNYQFPAWKESVPLAKAANYTVVEADNGKLMTNTGASGTIIFTLPAPVAGAHFGFFITAAQAITLTPASGTMVVDGNAADATKTFTGIGLFVDVWGQSSTSYLVTSSGASILAEDDSAITGYTAADDAAGQDYYSQTEDGGTDGGTASTGQAGGLRDERTGDGSDAVTTGAVGGAGGAFNHQAGAGGDGDTGGDGGAGGAKTSVAGAGGATATGTGGVGGGNTRTAGAGGACTGATGTGGAGGSASTAAGAGGSTTGAAGNAGVGGENIQTAGAGGGTTGAGDADAARGANAGCTGGAGGAATAGTGDGGDGGDVLHTPGALGASAGGTAGKIGRIINRGRILYNQPTPETATDTATLTDAQMLSTILVGTPTAAAAYTTRTGTQIEAALGDMETGDSFDLTIINLGGAGDIITLTAGGGVSVVGSATIDDPATDDSFPSSGTFRFLRSAANTFIAYRL